MTLRHSVGDLQALLLDVPPDTRHGRWASLVCALSSEVHEAIWAELPESEYVRETVIPLLQQALEAVRKIPQTDSEYDRKIPKYADNIAFRIESADEYIWKRETSARQAQAQPMANWDTA